MFDNLSPAEALKLLKEEATDLDIKFSPQIGFEKLKAKVDEVKEHKKPTEEKKLSKEELRYIKKAEAAAIKLAGTSAKSLLRSKMTPQQLTVDIMKEANALVRCSVTCLDPSKKDMSGTVMGVRNSKIPLNKHFVPYDGKITHLPKILINHLKEKEFQSFSLIEDPVSGEKVRRSRIGKMFSVAIMEPLSKSELNELAETQRATGAFE